MRARPPCGVLAHNRLAGSRPMIILAPMLGLWRASLPVHAAAQLESSPELGKADGACREEEPGPALIVTAVGLKDRAGLLKLEVYPDNDRDFLQDDNILVQQGKTFRRTEAAVPAHGLPQLCVRLPSAGRYAVSLLHDRNGNHKFDLSGDGAGFGGNPKIGWSKPRAAQSVVVAGEGVTRADIVLNYRKGLLAFGPLKR